MTVRALAGLLVLVVLVGATGWSVLRAFLPGLAVRSLVRFAGLAYVVGYSVLGATWTMMVIVGIPFERWTIILSAAAVGALAWLIARRRMPIDADAGVAPRSALFTVALPVASIAFLGLLAETLFRAARLKAVNDYDAWAFWIAKGKVIYYTGGLDEQFFSQIANPNYPPLVSLHDAAGFHAMGAVDPITLHVLSLVLAVAFLWAAAGLLVTRVPAWLLWPFLVLLAVTPRLETRFLVPEADLPLQYQIGLAVLLLAFWIDERKDWQLALGTVFLLGAVLTKREGFVFVAIVLVGAAVGSYGRLRRVLPRLALIAGLSALAAIPWRVWYASHGIQSETPPLGSLDLARARGSIHVSLNALREVEWGHAPELLLLALVVAALFGAFRLAVFQGVVLSGFFLAGAFGTYAYRELELSLNLAGNPILRVTGVIVITGLVTAPLLLAAVWRRHLPERELVLPGRRLSRRAAIVIVVGILLAYPAVLFARGAPDFPSQAECIHLAREGDRGALELVFERFDSPVAAESFRDDVVKAGFAGTVVAPDGCARWKVALPVASFANGQASATEARRAGFDPGLEVVVAKPSEPA